MITRLAVFGLVLVSALLLQTVVIPAVAVWGFNPDLVTITVIAFALADGPGTGGRYGFAAGLVVDLLSGGAQPVGVGALILLLVGYGVGASRPYLSGSALVGIVAVAVVGTGAATAGFGLLSYLLDAGTGTLGPALSAAAAAAVSNGLLAPLLVRPLGLLSQRFAAPAVS